MKCLKFLNLAASKILKFQTKFVKLKPQKQFSYCT